MLTACWWLRIKLATTHENPNCIIRPSGPHQRRPTTSAPTGNDLSGDGAAWATAWRTIAKAESSIANGDTVTVGAGDYQEYVNISGITNVTFLGVSNAQSCAFRFSAPSNTVSGFRLIAAQNEGYCGDAGIVPAR